MKKRNIGSAVLALVTLLALAPYDLGQVAMLFPPVLKPWIFILGAIGTCASRIWGKPESSAPSQLTQNFYNFNQPRTNSFDSTKDNL